MENPMVGRIRERLSALKISDIEAAHRAGLNKYYIYDFMIGKKDSLARKNLPLIAEALECDPRYLTSEIATPWPEPAGSASGTLAVQGLIAKNVWAKDNLATFSKVHVAPDPRYDVGSQSAWLVMGDDWKDRGIGDGSIVVASDALAPRVGDLLVVRRRRNGDETETTIVPVEAKKAKDDDAQESVDETVIGVIVMENRVFG